MLVNPINITGLFLYPPKNIIMFDYFVGLIHKGLIHLILEYVLSFSQMNSRIDSILILTQPAISCSKLTIETLEQGVKYVQS